VHDDVLEQRVKALETTVAALDELVDGQEDWSHRKRLHKLDADASAANYAREALKAYKRERDHLGTRVREWGGFALAAAAIVLTLIGHSP
jgi:type VI protein secretion system component VasF